MKSGSSLERQLRRLAPLRRTLDAAVTIASRQPVESLLLVGSMARGEISVRSEKEPFDLWSDIDFFIIGKPGGQVDQGRLRSEFRSLYSTLDMPNPFFHIDFTLLRSERLRLLPQRISTFEAKQNGHTMLGRDIQGDLPDVTLANLDYGNTKHLILIRLTEMLFFTPDRIAKLCPSPYEQAVFCYVQVRNALDILTILLPHEGVLLPTYTARSRFFGRNYGKMLSSAYFGSDFPDFQSESLSSKLTLAFNKHPIELFETTLTGYVNLVAFLIGAGPFNTIDEISHALERSQFDLSSRGTRFRQVLVDLRFTAHSKILKRPALQPALRKKMMIIFLLWMHSALLARLRGESDAMSYLNNAQEVLELLSVRPLPCPSRDFAEAWIGLRHKYLDIFTSAYAAKQTRRGYYQRVLQWRYGA